MADRAVTYFWDVQAWRASRSVQRMTWACRGMYREMLDEQRDNGSLPDCPRACADLLGGPVEQWIECWPMLRRNFVDRREKARHGDLSVHDPSDHNPSRRIINLKMARTMREQRAYYRERARSGQKGGLAKAQKRQRLQAGLATPELELSSSKLLANRSDQKREEEKGIDQKREEREEQKSGRSEPLTRSEPEDDSPVVATFPVIGPKGPTWPLRQRRLDVWRGLYPGVDVLAEARKALAWLDANPGRRKTFGGMPTFLVNWFNRSANTSRGPVGGMKTAENAGNLQRFMQRRSG